MYESHFGLAEPPFSIAPNPHYLYMSDRHREAMAHLVYGIGESGGFVQLTGEVGTGKTTLCRQLLAELPADVDVALILNPRIDEIELMQAICDELRVDYPDTPTVKQLIDVLNAYLLQAHSRGRHTVLIIDEAQNLTPGVLEQVRLLTNLETARQKLLRIILIGQSELREILQRPELRQLAQRITARYHLGPLTRREVNLYIRHRLHQAGCDRVLFSRGAAARIHAFSGGVPRLVNVVCDRALLGAWSKGRDRVTRSIVSTAVREVRGDTSRRWVKATGWAVGAILILAAPVAAYTFGWLPERVDHQVRQFLSSWVPRVEKSVFASGIHALAAVGVALARADEVTPRIEPRHDLAGEKRRLSLSATEPAPVVLSSIPLVDGAALLERLVNQRGGRVAALRQLARIWNVPNDTVFDCVGVGEFGLSCLGAIDHWDELVTFDRPAVVRLGESGTTDVFAVLRYVIGEQVVLEVDGDRVRLERDRFEAMWRHSAVAFWRRPPLVSIPVDERSQSEDILWLRRALNLEGANYGGSTLSRVEHDVFDTELVDALHSFQRRYGLDERDVAGQVELVLLNSRLGYDAHPRLVY